MKTSSSSSSLLLALVLITTISLAISVALADEDGEEVIINTPRRYFKPPTQVDPTACEEQATQEQSLFSKLKGSEREVCQYHPAKGRVYEFTANFAGSVLSIQKYSNMRVETVFDIMEDVSCASSSSAETTQEKKDDDENESNDQKKEEKKKDDDEDNNNNDEKKKKNEEAETKEEGGDAEKKNDDNNNAESPTTTKKQEEPKVDGIFLTNAKGERITPEWLSSSSSSSSSIQSTDGSSKKKKKRSGGRRFRPVTNFEKTTLIRVERTEPGNVLSNFEILFQVFVAIQTFNLEKKPWRVVFKDKSDKHHGDDIVFYPLKRKFGEQSGNADTILSFFPDYLLSRLGKSASRNQMSELSNTLEFSGYPFTAALSAPVLCPSPALRKFIRWYLDLAHLVEPASGDDSPSSSSSNTEGKKKKKKENNKSPHQAPMRPLRVLFSRRQPVKTVVRSKTMGLPSRRLEEEMNFVLELADELGTGVDFNAIDFAEKDAAGAIQAVQNADVLVGVHGSGLTWGALFLPPGRSALVEIFTNDLPSQVEKISPYKKIATMNGIEYTSSRIRGKYRDPPFKLPMEGEQREIEWSLEDVKAVADAVRLLPFQRKIQERTKWCKAN